MSAPRKYNDEWILVNYDRYRTVLELTNAYNAEFNDNVTRRVLGCHCEKKLGLHKNQKYFTEEHDEWLRLNFSRLGRKECTKQFNERFNQSRSEEVIKVHCNKQLGIRIDKNDWRKHKLSSARYSIGHEVTDANGYILIKIDEHKYVTKQRYVYEQAYGTIPKGNVVVFLDGDRTNFSLDNLMCVPNSYIRSIMIQRYSPFIRNTETVSPELKRLVNKEIIRIYELEKRLQQDEKTNSIL